jgi:hypothetical protein
MRDRLFQCGCFMAATGEQCLLASDHIGAHRFASGRMSPERLASIRERSISFADSLRSAEQDCHALLAELDAVTAERDAARMAQKPQRGHPSPYPLTDEEIAECERQDTRQPSGAGPEPPYK